MDRIWILVFFKLCSQLKKTCLKVFDIYASTTVMLLDLLQEQGMKGL